MSNFDKSFVFTDAKAMKEKSGAKWAGDLEAFGRHSARVAELQAITKQLIGMHSMRAT